MTLQGVGQIIQTGGLSGVVAALLWMLWTANKDHAAAMKDVVSKAVYEDVCRRADRQADLLGDLSKSVAILVDRRSEAR